MAACCCRWAPDRNSRTGRLRYGTPIRWSRSRRTCCRDLSPREQFLDETTLAVAHPGEDRVSLYDVTTGEQIDALEIPGLEPEIVIDSKGGRLVVAGSNGTQVWDLESRSLLWSGDMGPPREVDPDRGWLAVGGFEAVVTILDLDDGSEVMTLSGHIGAIDDVAFDPSRDRLYSTADGETLAWDITPTGPVGAGVLPIDPGEMWVSPDGGELAIANDLSLTTLRLELPEHAWPRSTGIRTGGCRRR